MFAARNPIDDRVSGNTPQELQRLKMQARPLEAWREQFLLTAGIEPGMSVLDLGCGVGDVSLLAARLVGRSGHVTAIERNLVVIEKARERTRAEGRGANIEFVHAELLNFYAKKSFDAVVGRYGLLFQPDPVAAVAHAARQVRPEGIIVFHETDLASRIRSYRDGKLFEKTYALIAETERREDVLVNLGLHLTHLFLDTLVARVRAEAVVLHTQPIGPLQFGAWTRNPEPLLYTSSMRRQSNNYRNPPRGNGVVRGVA